MSRYYRYRDRGWETGPRAIWVLIAANVLVFIATFFRPDALDFLAIQRHSLAAQPWTLVTSMFTHVDMWHILGNMFMLWFFGSYLERGIGEVKFLALYFIGGLAGNGLFLLLAPPFASAVGASGAVFALGGALAVMHPKIKIVLFPIPIPMDLWVYVLGTSVLLGLLPALGNSRIGWQAHLGGLAVGLLAGVYFRHWERRRGIR